MVAGGADGIGRECALAHAWAKARGCVLDVNLVAARRTAEDGAYGMALHGYLERFPRRIRNQVGAQDIFGRIAAVHNNPDIATPQSLSTNPASKNGKCCSISL